LRIFAPGRQQKIYREHHKIRGHDPKRATSKEASKIDALATREWREQLSTDQITAENEEKINSDPAKAMHPARQRKTHDPGVINDDHNNRERAKKIEPWLAFTIGESRINSQLERRCRFGWQLVNGGKLACRVRGSHFRSDAFPLALIRMSGTAMGQVFLPAARMSIRESSP
jgi:hypothetical protein